MMFAEPAVDLTRAYGSKGHYGRFHSRVRALPEFGNELPVATLAEEMLTEGPGQVRALLTFAGNPVLSTPNGRQLDRALEGLEFMVSVDPYINETTRHAQLILPPVSPLERSHYDIALSGFAVRNVAKYSPALFEKPAGALHDHEILAELTARLGRSPRKRGTRGAGARGLRAPARPGRPARSHAAHRRLRHALPGLGALGRGPPRTRRDSPAARGAAPASEGPEPAPARGVAAWSRPRAARAEPAATARDAGRQAATHARALRAGPRPGIARARSAGASPDADRSPARAQQQFLDAQQPAAGEGQGALHARHPSGRCGTAGSRGRVHRATAIARRRGEGDRPR